MKLHVVLFVAVAACVARASSLQAFDLSTVVSDYRITSWAGGDGIAIGEVRSIAQDQDGYLWLATDGGVIRFDGIRFARTDLVASPMVLPTAATRAVYVARDGSLWVGYGDRLGLYRIAGGEVRQIHLKDQLNGFINAIVEDRHGALWVGHDEGVLRFQDGRWEPIKLPAAGPDRRVLDIYEDRSGTLWVAAISGLYRHTGGEGFERVPNLDGPVRSITEGPAGELWISDDRAGFRQVHNSGRTHLFEARGIRVFHDSRDNLWVTTLGQGLWQVRNITNTSGPPAIRRATARTGLVSDSSSAVFEDRDGNIWIGSVQGLNRLAPDKVTSLSDIGEVRALALSQNGTAWAGTTTGLVELSGVTPRSAGKSRLVSTSSIRALHTSRDGTVWAATGDGLYKVIGGRLVPVSLVGPPLHRITSIESDARGALWVCDSDVGLIRIAHGHVERLVAATNGVSVPPLLTYVDDRDTLWIAFKGGLLRRLDTDGRVTGYGPAEGLPHSAVYAIYRDRRGELWVGGTDGLSRLSGDRFQTVTIHNDGPFHSIAWVIDDDAGDLWVGIDFFGFIRVRREEISRALTDPSYPLRYLVYSASSGTGYPTLRSSDTGRGPGTALWFVTSSGITVFDPQELRQKPDEGAGAPRIEGVTADSHRYRFATAGLVLPPRTSRLRIDYTVLSLSSLERIRFRYKLDGFDTEWIDGTGPREALYTNLPSGSYRFRLQASANGANWSDAEADWPVSIQPAFYETRWFYLACAVALVLFGMAAWRQRIRHAQREVALVFGERLRLSREIHDTLLQGLYGIALQLDAANHYLPDSQSPLRVLLMRLRRRVEDYISEARHSIWDLRSPSLDRRDLVEALQHTGDTLTAGKVQFALKVTGRPRPCPLKVEKDVLRIGHEAIMNAVRHADAERVDIELGFDDESLRLRVVDNGRGFDPQLESERPDHYGLMSMKERAAGAGGSCTIQSMLGGGVEVIAEFPHSSFDMNTVEKRPIRVLIVDDHWVVRDGLTLILGREDDIDVVGVAATGAEAVAAFERHDPDIVLMDLQMPGMSGTEAIRNIRGSHPDARVIVLTMYDGDEDIHRALEAGAATYCLKGSPSDELIRVIRDVYAGERPLHPDVQARLEHGVAQPRLTARETAVLERVLHGDRNKEIGAQLSISEETVQVHLKNIFAKLDVHDRAAAVYVALRRGIIHLR